MSATTSGRRKRLRWAGLILGLLGAGWASFVILFMIVVGAAMNLNPLYKLSPEDWLRSLAAGLIVIGGVAIAWKWELIGGILLIAEGLFVIQILLNIGYFVEEILEDLSFFGLLGSPVLFSGVLFLHSWQIGRIATVERPKWLRWAGLILGLLGVGLASFVAWRTGFGILRILIPGLIVIGSVAIAWKWALIGGILLIAESLFVSIRWGFPSLPLLVSGLFLISWWIGQRPSQE